MAIRDSEKPTQERVQRLLAHAKIRYTFLIREVDIDPAEVILVAALWVAIIHRMVWEGVSDYPQAYQGVLKLVGPGRGSLVTGGMLFLGTSGFLSIMMYLPKIRRTIGFLVGFFFMLSGVSSFLLRPDSLFPWIEILVFGGAGIWTYWRQGTHGSGTLSPKRISNTSD